MRLSRCAALVLFALVLLAVPAYGKTRPPGTKVYVPPGLSSASQYTEVVPTAGGGTPSGRLHAGTGDSSGAGGSATGSRTIPASVARRLDAAGPTGKAALALAEAAAPVSAHHSRKHARGAQATTSAPARRVESADTSRTVDVLGALTGSAGGGIFLPLILIGSVIVGTGLGLLRMRR